MVKALERASVLSWQNCIARILGRCRDLFGRESWRWRVIRTPNVYAFNARASAPEACRLLSRNIRTGTPNQEEISVPTSQSVAARDVYGTLERARRPINEAIDTRLSRKGSAIDMPAT